LSPAYIAQDYRFSSLTEVWLKGDHYKWRAMRTMGIDEFLISGEASDLEKFKAWARTVPRTLRNPLFHWTHLELERYFDESRLLNESTANEIYKSANQSLQNDPQYTARGLLRRMNVRLICTTDDPIDDLSCHISYERERSETDPIMLPAFRPDRALVIDGYERFNQWIDELIEVVGFEIVDADSLLQALLDRHNFFHRQGCRLADYGIERMYAMPSSGPEANKVFRQIRSGVIVSEELLNGYRAYILYNLAKMHYSAGWVQQYHLGASRDSNQKGVSSIGQATGYDSIGDDLQGRAIITFLNHLELQDSLAKTILYCLNPRDNALFASIIGSFQKGPSNGKIQFGSGWWFNDTLEGMKQQIDALSSIGFLDPFVGMLTDSRSFLSFPRHEYFRRLLANILGQEMQSGLLPMDYGLVGGMLRKICYENALNYFDFPTNKG